MSESGSRDEGRDLLDGAEFQPGQRVADTQEDGKHLRVVSITPQVAEDSRIAAIGKTVAEVNECPPTDRVYLCVYESHLDERFGSRWRDWSGCHLAYHTGSHGLRTYSFPEVRLAPAEQRSAEKWAEADRDE